MARNDTRGLYLHIPGDVMDRLLAIATEDGTSVTRLVQQWVVGAIRDHPRKEG